MKLSKKKLNIVFVALITVLISGTVIFSCCTEYRIQTFLAAEFFTLFLAVAYMLFMLRISISETLYTYKNIGLIAGILFCSVLGAVSLSFFICFFRSEAITVTELYRTLVTFPRRFSYYSMIFIIVVSILVGISNVALIRHEGFCLNNALCLLFAGFYIGATVLVYLIDDILTSRLFLPQGFYDDPVFAVFTIALPMFLLLMLCYFECVFVGTAVMGWIAARHKPSLDKDFIIILGCSIDKRGGLLPLLKGRVNRAVRFAWEQEIATGKPMKYVPSGGQGANEIMSEGSAMELYLLSHGAEDYEVFPEKKSVSTWENMLFSKRIIQAEKADARIAFATTNYHVLRSGILAREAGLDAEGIAGDTKWYFWPNGFVREFFAILALNIRSHLYVGIFSALLCGVVGLIGTVGDAL